MNKPLKILIVDDENAVLMSLEAHFEDEGFEVISAESAEDALKQMSGKQVDAAIIDLLLPGMDGIELIRKLKEKCPRIAYIIYTGSIGYKIPEDIKGMKEVSNTVFIKPIYDLNKISDEVYRLVKTI